MSKLTDYSRGVVPEVLAFLRSERSNSLTPALLRDASLLIRALASPKQQRRAFEITRELAQFAELSFRGVVRGIAEEFPSVRRLP